MNIYLSAASSYIGRILYNLIMASHAEKLIIGRGTNLYYKSRNIYMYYEQDSLTCEKRILAAQLKFNETDSSS